MWLPVDRSLYQLRSGIFSKTNVCSIARHNAFITRVTRPQNGIILGQIIHHYLLHVHASNFFLKKNRIHQDKSSCMQFLFLQMTNVIYFQLFLYIASCAIRFVVPFCVFFAISIYRYKSQSEKLQPPMIDHLFVIREEKSNLARFYLVLLFLSFKHASASECMDVEAIHRVR